MKNKNKDGKEEFPEYPHYNKKEDIYNNAEELNGSIEDVAKGKVIFSDNEEKPLSKNEILDELPIPVDMLKDEEDKPQSEFDITDDDLAALASLDDETDDPDNKDGINNNRVYPLDMSGDDLDVPGAEDDDINEEIGEEDEENNFYSLPEDQD